MGLTFALLAATLIPQSAPTDADLVKAREALIPELITLLITPQYGHHYVSEAAWARETLVAIGDPAVPALIEALKSEDQDVRDAATDALRDLKVKRAVPALKSAFFTTKDQFVRGQILETVAKLDGGLAVDFVIQALDPDNLSSIYSAIYAIGETKDPRAIPTLERYLLSPDVPKGDPDRISITRQAAFALSELGAHGLRSLKAAYSSDNQVVREEAADAILGMRELEAVPLVLRVLQGAKDLKDPIGSVWGISDHKAISNAVWAMLESSDLKIRVGATQALENQGDAAHLALLERVLVDSCRTYPGDQVDLRRRVIRNLAEIIQSVRDKARSPAIRRAIEWMLQSKLYKLDEIAPLVETFCEEPHAIDADFLMQLALLRSPDEKYRFETAIEVEAAIALGKIGEPQIRKLREHWKKGAIKDYTYACAFLGTEDPKAFPWMQEALESKDKTLRDYAVNALACVRDGRAEPILLKLITDPDLKDDVIDSLLELGNKETIKLESREEQVSWRFAFALKNAEEPMVEDVLKNGSPRARIAAAELKMERKQPGGIETIVEIAKAAKDLDDVASQAIEYSDNDELLRKCLKVNSLQVRATAFRALKKLLDDPPKAKDSKVTR